MVRSRTDDGSLPPRRVRRGSRKIVTVLFVDVVDFTALSEELDPESVRSLMERYFAVADELITHHGGYIEKFIGDAVMAVFGIPTLHDDDALRAVTAAVQLAAGLDSLNAEFRATWGTSIAVRIGADSGEAIVGVREQDQLYVTGPAVITAARLEQAAAPGEILIGEGTYQLVRDAVIAEGLGPIPLKGKHDDIAAWRVHGIDLDAVGWRRRPDAPMVGRTSEVDHLLAMFDRATKSGCQLATLLGPAGIGKSRLGREVVARLGERGTVLSGRCLSYGKGITFWPLVEVLQAAARITESDTPAESVAKVRALLPQGREGDLISARLAGLLGGDSPAAIHETFWAVRRLLEHMAVVRPVVVVFDDIHWAEPSFLQLVEYLTDRATEAPILLICLARDELLDSSPGWTRPRTNATLIPLPPLTGELTHELVERLLDTNRIDPAAVERISEVAEGNPLFVEETLRMLADRGQLVTEDGRWTLIASPTRLSIPSTIQALVSARLDQLDDELAVLQRAAIVGKVFGWGEVAALCEDEQLALRTAAHLQSLVHRQLIRPRRDDLTENDAFEFSHVLIWDVAYEQIPKVDRAHLHEKFAERLENSLASSTDYSEIIGYHLEQAHRVLRELEPMSPRGEPLAERASARLSTAGLRAYARGDMPAAASLLHRSVVLAREGRADRTALLPRLAFAYMETGAFAPLQDVVAEIEVAAKSGDEAMRAHGTVLRLWIRLFTDPVGWAELAEEQAAIALRTFTTLRDDSGLSMASALLALVKIMQARFGDAEEHWWQASIHASRANDRRDELEALSWIPLTVWCGPTPSEEGLRRCNEVLLRADGDKKATAGALIAQATFDAGLSRFDDARLSLRRAGDLLEEVALAVWLAGPHAQFSGWVELLAGDAEAAERVLRQGYNTLQEIGETSWFSTVAGLLGEAVIAADRHQEAPEFADASREAAAPDDVYSQVLWRTVAAKVAAREGRPEDARQLAGQAVELLRGTDFLHLQWHALLTQAVVLEQAGRSRDAATSAEAAADVARRKGSVVAERRAREVRQRLNG
jgi:class 3 adenylate cyclase